jgi:MFS family permease
VQEVFVIGRPKTCRAGSAVLGIVGGPMLDLLRRNRDFRALFCAQVVSYAGDWFATVALLGLVLDLTDSALAATLIFVAQSLPAFLMSPFAGPAADRFNRRVLMASVSALQVLAALTFLLIGHSTVWVAYLGQGAISAFGAFFQPASQAALPNLVDPEDLATATVLNSAVWGAMLGVGAALGGLFTAVFGRTASFVADAVSFAIAAALIASIRRPMNVTRAASGRIRPFADTAEAFRYARRHPVVLARLGSKMGFGLASGVAGLLAVFATEKFHGGDAATGVLLAARGVGVVAGPLLARRVTDRGTGAILRACGVAGLVYAVGYGALPFAPVLPLAAIGVMFAHLGGGGQWTLSTYGLQVSTVDEFRGRVFAGDLALVMLTMTLSFTLAGAAAQRWGPEPVTLALAGISAVWGMTYLAITKAVRRAEELPFPEIVEVDET